MAVRGAFWTPLVGLFIIVLALVAAVRTGDTEQAASLDADLPPLMRAGTVLSVPGTSHAHSARTLVIFTDSECPFTEASLPYYRKLTSAAQSASVRVLILAAGSEGVVRQWLKDGGLESLPFQWIEDPNSVGLLFTPTLVVTGTDGVISDIAIGQLSGDEEVHLLQRITGTPGAAPLIKGQPAAELTEDQLPSTADLQFLDIRGRERRRGSRMPRREAHSIPLDELELRAPVELLRGRRIVVDCSEGSDMPDCRSAGMALEYLGFHDVVILRPRR